MNWQKNTTTALWLAAFFVFVGLQIFVTLMVIDTGHYDYGHAPAHITILRFLSAASLITGTGLAAISALTKAILNQRRALHSD